MLFRYLVGVLQNSLRADELDQFSEGGEVLRQVDLVQDHRDAAIHWMAVPIRDLLVEDILCAMTIDRPLPAVIHNVYRAT